MTFERFGNDLKCKAVNKFCSSAASKSFGAPNAYNLDSTMWNLHRNSNRNTNGKIRTRTIQKNYFRVDIHQLLSARKAGWEEASAVLEE